MIKISPSLLSADFCNLGEQIKKLESAKADLIHIDVMDGSFVPNITFGIPVIKSIRKITGIPFDVHLMIENPSVHIESFKNAGADIITIHYETEKHLDRTLSLIKSLGLKASIALNPATPVWCIKDVLPLCDMVLIMTVNPGFGGQSFIGYTLNKVYELSELKKKMNLNFDIEVDGGINKANITAVVQKGANVIVAGSAVFKNGLIEENIKSLKREL